MPCTWICSQRRLIMDATGDALCIHELLLDSLKVALCWPILSSLHFGMGYAWSGMASVVDGFFHNPRSGLVHFLAMALVGCGPLSCSVRLCAPLAAGKFTRLVRVYTAGGTGHNQYLFRSKSFRLHADYDATILSASCVGFPDCSLVLGRFLENVGWYGAGRRGRPA